MKLVYCCYLLLIFGLVGYVVGEVTKCYDISNTLIDCPPGKNISCFVKPDGSRGCSDEEPHASSCMDNSECNCVNDQCNQHIFRCYNSEDGSLGVSDSCRKSCFISTDSDGEINERGCADERSLDDLCTNYNDIAGKQNYTCYCNDENCNGMTALQTTTLLHTTLPPPKYQCYSSNDGTLGNTTTCGTSCFIHVDKDKKITERGCSGEAHDNSVCTDYTTVIAKEDYNCYCNSDHCNNAVAPAAPSPGVCTGNECNTSSYFEMNLFVVLLLIIFFALILDF